MKALALQLLYAIDRATETKYNAVVDLVACATCTELHELDAELTALNLHIGSPLSIARAELLRWVRLYRHINTEA